jgi:hypothetical protein
MLAASWLESALERLSMAQHRAQSGWIQAQNKISGLKMSHCHFALFFWIIRDKVNRN